MDLLIRDGFDAQVFTYSSLRQWSDRKKKVELVLIPGVVFVKNAPNLTKSIYRYPQVIGVLREFGKPALVSQQEINNLLLITKEWNGERIPQAKSANFQKGDLVEVTSGDFRGLIGELTTTKGKHRLVVNIHSLNIAFTVELPKSKVKHLNASNAA
jgi:transcription antitermination factor NusG